MQPELVVSPPSVFLSAGCSMHYNVLDPDEVEFIIKGSGRTFELAFTAEALRHFLDLGATAHQEMLATEPREWGQSNPNPLIDPTRKGSVPEHPLS